jgi:hypothetical protein
VHPGKPVVLACLSLLPITACGGSAKAHSTSHRATTSASATPAPVLPGPDRLKAALLPKSSFSGYKRFGPSSGQFTSDLGARMAEGIGLPAPTGACQALGRLVDINTTADGVAQTPAYADVTYIASPASEMAYESLFAVPAETAPSRTELHVPANCTHYTGRFQGHRTTVSVRALAAGSLPSISGADVTGIETTMRFSGSDPVLTRTVSVRQGTLLMLVAAGGGDPSTRAGTTATHAWTQARSRLGG